MSSTLLDARHRIAFLRGIGRDLHLSDPNLAQTADDAQAFIDALARAAKVAENLLGMVDRETWRSTGGDDGQGHYEGDYHAEQVAQEIASWKAATDA